MKIITNSPFSQVLRGKKVSISLMQIAATAANTNIIHYQCNPLISSHSSRFQHLLQLEQPLRRIPKRLLHTPPLQAKYSIGLRGINSRYWHGLPIRLADSTLQFWVCSDYR